MKTNHHSRRSMLLPALFRCPILIATLVACRSPPSSTLPAASHGTHVHATVSTQANLHGADVEDEIVESNTTRNSAPPGLPCDAREAGEAGEALTRWEGERVIFAQPVRFEIDSEVIRAESLAVIRSLAARICERPGLRVEVQDVVLPRSFARRVGS